jgi:hypothetical protein
MCGICGVQNIDTKQLNLFTDDEIERIIYDIYTGTINLRNLDVHSYLKVARKLSEGVFQGYGKNMDNMMINTPDYKMLSSLKDYLNSIIRIILLLNIIVLSHRLSQLVNGRQ